MVSREEEQELILRSRNGDHEAFAMLVRAHQRMVHAVTFRMTGSAADAEDLAQEVFIQAHRQLDAFRGDARISSWLCRVAINTSLNWTKRERRRQQIHQELLEPPARLAEPSNEADALSRRVQDALMKLPPKQRAAVVLTTYDGLSHAEAGRVLGCSETTVSWRVFSARVKLRRLLKEFSRPAGGPT